MTRTRATLFGAFSPDPPSSPKPITGMKTKLAVLVLLAAVIAAATIYAPVIREWLLAAAHWAESSPELAWPIYIVVVVTIIVLAMPSLIFMVAAGYLFGLVNGFILASVAHLTGAVLAFYLARTVARDWIKEKIDHSPRFSGFDAALSRRGLYTVMFARLALLPNNIINYACGVTGMRLRDYVIGTAIGFTPVLTVCVLFGASAVDLATALESGGPEREFSPLMIVGAVVLVFALVLVLARRYGPRLASPDPD